MSKSTDPNVDQWASVSRLLPITDKEVGYLHITANRLRALSPDRAWAESLETNAALDGVSVPTDARKRLAAYAQRFLKDRQNHDSANR